MSNLASVALGYDEDRRGIMSTTLTRAMVMPEARRAAPPKLMTRFRRNPGAIVGTSILVFLACVAVVGPLLVGDPLQQDILVRSTPPNGIHPMGTDEFGRDILSRVIYGTRISLLSGLGVVLFGTALGVLFGSLAGYYGGIFESVIMAAMDMLLAFPAVLLAVSIAAGLGPSLATATIAIGVVNVPYFARLIRSAILSVKYQEYFEAARVAGASDARIIRLHLLPNVITPVIVQATIRMGMLSSWFRHWAF